MKQQKYKFVVLNEADNVAVALENIPSGATVHHGDGHLKMIDAITFGHKFAIRHINAGDPIMKYGETIGSAMRNIQPGEHVHVHNLEGIRGRGDKIAK